MGIQKVICLAIAGCFGLFSQAGAVANHLITCNGSTSGQLATLINGGTVHPGDAVLITGFCVGDVFVPGGVKLTNHGNTAAISTTDGIQGQVQVGASPNGQVTINGLTLKGYATNTGVSANLFVGIGGQAFLFFSNVTAAQQDGIEIDGGNVVLQSDAVGGNGIAQKTSHNNGIRIKEGGSLTDGVGTSTISGNKGYGIAVEGGYVDLGATNLSGDVLGEIYGFLGSSSVSFQTGKITSTSAHPAIQLLSGSTATLLQATVAGTNGAVLASGASNIVLVGSTLSSSTAAAPAIEAASASSITLAGGNIVSNSASGGTAIMVDRNSSLLQMLSSRIVPGFTNAPETVTGLGSASANSSLDLGLGLIGTSPSLKWTGNIAVSLNSFVKMSGGVAVTGSLALSGNSGADFLLTNGGTNAVSAGVSCPTAGTTVTSYVTNPTSVTPNVLIGATKPACLQD